MKLCDWPCHFPHHIEPAMIPQFWPGDGVKLLKAQGKMAPSPVLPDYDVRTVLRALGCTQSPQFSSFPSDGLLHVLLFGLLSDLDPIC